MSITYTTVTSEEELQQILTLQQNNLPISISKSEKEIEGFLTVQHDLEILKKMNTLQPHVIAKDSNKVVGYALCMLKDFKEDIEILKPMFTQIEAHLDAHISYFVMGQICVDKAYRKQGIFRGLYQTIKKESQQNYNLLITEVASNNLRSLQAHYAIGFKTLITHKSDGVEWHLIHWNWE
ncbi:GNAT family N-acetyltransferase [Aquimarina algiphila]|uniref:GNAT family N-acetyltransferase n=1 Tax=Aquimarina algiphila TaxID=2047982 RepID=UPI00232A9ECC|nr:GNAT family N-acetyltransferase [Aquimarina algiphila]